MIRLDNVNTSLEVVLAGAVSSTQPQVTACYSTKTSTTYTGAKATVATSSASNVTVISAPVASSTIDVDYLSIYNRDTASVTFTFQYNVSGTRTIIAKMTLATLEMAVYIHGQGWSAIDAAGGTKATTLPSGAAGGDLSGTYPNPTVAKINGTALGTTTATNTNVLIANGTNWSTQTLSGAFTITNVGVATLATVQPATGGTGITSYAIGDILYASGATTLSKLADVAAGSYLRSGGVTTAPVWSTTTLPNSATTGDLLYASATNTYTNLADVATGNALISGGVGIAPSWGKIALTTHVSGTLPVANGGTGTTTSTGTGSVVLSADPALTGNPTAPTASENDNDTSIATTAFVNANIAGTFKSNGNTSTNNTGTPNTQFDLTANQVLLMNTNGHIVSRTSPGTITNNISTAGSTANGRDQAGAFSNSSWIYFYWIWNGTTLASLSSASATTPTLPSTYTHFCLCTAARLDGSGNIIRIKCGGSWAFYTARINILASGSATTETAVDDSSVVPPGALEAQAEVTGDNISDASGVVTLTQLFRVFSGSNFYALQTQLSGLGLTAATLTPGAVVRFPNIAQNFYYLNTNTAGTGRLGVTFHGYKNPNGGE